MLEEAKKLWERMCDPSDHKVQISHDGGRNRQMRGGNKNDDPFFLSLSLLLSRLSLSLCLSVSLSVSLSLSLSVCLSLSLSLSLSPSLLLPFPPFLFSTSISETLPATKIDQVYL